MLKAAGAAGGLFALGAGPGTASAHAHSHNLAEALQQSLYFYDANYCGPDVTGGRLLWRGDCHTVDTAVPLEAPVSEGGTDLSAGFIDQHRDVLDPDGTGTVDVSGGFHDAGDHVKFGLPQAYSASSLAWACNEFADAFREIGEYDHLLDHLRRFADYFRRCTFRDDAGDVVAFCYQVSNGGNQFDHNYWGSPEVQDPETSPRPAYFATAENPASDRSAAAAAALAAIAAALEDEDSTYAAECLETAAALYAFADEHRGIPNTAAGYYDSTNDADHLCWAAIWLYENTGDEAYLEAAIGTDGNGTYTGHVGDIIDTVEDGWDNAWVHSWDSVWGGVFAKLTDVTDDDRWRELAFWNLAFWSGGDVSHESSSSRYIDTTPAGFSFLNQWGSARYNAAAQFTAVCYRNYTGNEAVTDWALTQMEYILGDNPFGYSLVVGYGDDHAEHPHHDAAHGTTSGRPTVPEEHRHTLWGALVGGPDSSDNHVDETNEYTLNEVAIDYNAGLVGALAGLYTFYADDDEALESFPPEDERVVPYAVDASVSGDSSGATVDATLTVDEFYPPRLGEEISYRYVFEASGDGTAVSVSADDSTPTVSSPTAWPGADDTYYVEVDYGGQATGGSYSLTLELDAGGVAGFSPTEYAPVYVAGEHFYGARPDGDGESDPPVEEDCIAIDGYQACAHGEDGLYRDVDGTGTTGSNDVVVFFEQFESDAIQSNPQYFDYNDSGSVGFDDVVALFQQL